MQILEFSSFSFVHIIGDLDFVGYMEDWRFPMRAGIERERVLQAL